MSDTELLLRKRGLRTTKQRKAILDILKSRKLPATAEDVFLELKVKDISANISTVYRTLDTMFENRIINKFNIVGDDRAFYELASVKHRHFLVCIGCKAITPITGCPLSGYEKTIEAKTNYRIAGHRLNIYGYCPKCALNDKK